MNPEVFYLHIGGEQRGPYTVPQIDHLLNSGLIAEETLYWREGMEQWQAVTNLVGPRRQRPGRKWAHRAIWLLLLVPLLLLARLFGPIAVVGWRETAQYDFTPRAAYWRARDVVRHQALPAGAAIVFSTFDKSRVELNSQPAGAKVWLHTETVEAHSQTKTAAWEVTLGFNSQQKEWSGRSVREAAP